MLKSRCKVGFHIKIKLLQKFYLFWKQESKKEFFHIPKIVHSVERGGGGKCTWTKFIHFLFKNVVSHFEKKFIDFALIRYDDFNLRNLALFDS